jgi:hypothetical protein
MKPVELSDVQSLDRNMLEYQCLKARAQYHSHRYANTLGFSLLLMLLAGKQYLSYGLNIDVATMIAITVYYGWEFFSKGMSRERHAAAAALDDWMEENGE